MLRLLSFFVLSFCIILMPGSAQALRVEPSIIIASSPQTVYYGSTTFYCYPNNLLVPANYIYNKRTIRDMARLSRHMGWRHVYILSPQHPYGMPSHYRHYANHHFGQYGISYRYYYPYNRGYHSRHYYNNRSYQRSGFYFRFNF